MLKNQQHFWNVFSQNKMNILTFLKERGTLEQYLRYFFNKLSKKGYQSVELRASLSIFVGNAYSSLCRGLEKLSKLT